MIGTVNDFRQCSAASPTGYCQAIKRDLDSVVVGWRQPIAHEGVLPYRDGNKLKKWDSLQRFDGKFVPIVDEHPDRNNGRNGLLTGSEKVYGVGFIQKCPNKTLCADMALEDSAPRKKGYSIGYIYNHIDEAGVYKGQAYQSVQDIQDIDHIALTNSPRDARALATAGDSDNTKALQNNTAVNKYWVGYDSFKEFINDFELISMTKPDSKSEGDGQAPGPETPTPIQISFDANGFAQLAQTLTKMQTQLDSMAEKKTEADAEVWKNRFEELKGKYVERDAEQFAADIDSLVKKYDFDKKFFHGIDPNSLAWVKKVMDLVDVSLDNYVPSTGGDSSPQGQLVQFDSSDLSNVGQDMWWDHDLDLGNGRLGGWRQRGTNKPIKF